MKVKYNHWFAPMIPFMKKKGKVYGKAMFNTIYVSFPEKHKVHYSKLLKHELTHIQQQKADRFFYPKYFWEWLINIIELKGKVYQAYQNISYEVEAREKEITGLTQEEWKLF